MFIIWLIFKSSKKIVEITKDFWRNISNRYYDLKGSYYEQKAKTYYEKSKELIDICYVNTKKNCWNLYEKNMNKAKDYNNRKISL